MAKELNNASSPLSPVGAKLFGADAAGNAGWIPCQPQRRPMTIVLLGDSITAGNTSGNYDSDTGFFTWGNALAGAPFTLLHNAGVGGETSTQILARVDADVLAHSPGYCMVLCGTNDPDTGTDVLKANIAAIYDKLSAAGIYTFLQTIPPTPSGTTAKKAQIVAVNRWLVEFCATKTDAELLDVYSVLVDNASTTMAAKANVMRDSAHPSNYGAQLVGQLVAEHFAAHSGNSRRLVVSACDAYAVNSTSLNHTQNPLMAGTAGSKELNATGNVATNYGLIGYQLTVVGSKEPHVDGYGEWQVMTASDVTGTSDFVRLKYTDPNPPPLEGQTFYLECDLLVESATSLRNVYLYSATQGLFGCMSAGSGPRYPVAIPEGGLRLTLRTRPVTFSANATSSIELRLDFNFLGAVAGPAAVIKVGRMAFVRVD